MSNNIFRGNQSNVNIFIKLILSILGELTVRIWDIETNDNFALSTSMKLYINDDKFQAVNEIFTCIAYCKMNQTLCAGTNIGRIYFWNKINCPNIDNPEDAWELNNINTISGTIKQLLWGSVMLKLPILSVNCVTSVYIMKEQNISCSFSEKIWATQKTADQVFVETNKSNRLLQLDQQITDMAISEQLLVCSNGKIIIVFEISWKNDNEEYSNNKSETEKGKLIFTFYPKL